MAPSGRSSSTPETSHPERTGRTGSKERRGILETIFFESGSRRAPPPRRSRLVDLCSPWLGTIIALRGLQQLPEPGVLRLRALELKSELERSAREAGFTAADTEAAAYALVAFLDETVLNAPGPTRDAWISRPLQLELFGQNVAGEEFYARLESYRKAREDRIEALEVYYCCLAFGFAGKLRLAGPERLKALLEEVERDVAAVRGASRRSLAPHVSRHEEVAAAVAEGIPRRLFVAGFVLATIVAYLAIWIIARHSAARAASAIRELIP